MREDFSDQHWEWFSFSGVKSTSYGVWISGENTFVAAERDIEDVIIPGRNGTLTLDNGRWKNITIKYPCYMSGTFLTDFQAFKADLLKNAPRGFLTLTDSYHPGYYRKARLKGGLVPKPGPYNRSAQFDVTFEAWPQLYLTAGDENITITGGSGTIPAGTGSTQETFAHPLVQILVSGSTGNKSGSVTFGTGTAATTISFADYPYDSAIGNGNIRIDCETKTIQTMNTTDLVWYSVAEYFTLDSGHFFTLGSLQEAVTYTGNISSVIVKPRWWTL